jgi:nucleotide-binding universal stress UspA family protein
MDFEEGEVGTMTVIVGVDGSTSALQAVLLATREAAWRGSPLRIVHAFGWSMAHVPVGPGSGGPPDGGLRHDAERLLAEAATLATQTDPAVQVTTDLIEGMPSPVLLALADSAELIVLGDRGLGGFTGLLIGSVAVQVAAHSPVPVLVARGVLGYAGPIIVGVDGTPESANTIDWAFREAALRRVELLAVHTWIWPVEAEPSDMLPMVYDFELTQANEERLLAEALAGRGPTEGGLRQHTVRGRASRVLVELSENAQLIVVGSRGRGGFAGLLLGSTSQQVLHHSRCPVMVVPRKV